MIRLLLFSRDLKIQSALAPATGVDFGIAPDFRIAIDSSRERVRRQVLEKRCDVVLLDLEGYPLTEQLDFHTELQNLGMPVVVVAEADPHKRRELERRGIREFCEKPLSPPELTTLIHDAHERTVNGPLLGNQADNPATLAPDAGYGELVGSSAKAKAVYDLIQRVAGLNAFVLITGESGTGKELIAHAIHSRGQRESGVLDRTRRFVAVSCGAIPESLIEAELFGYEKGAFTGALQRRAGYLEEAGDGTLFLDEIGELSQHTQVKLLRVLQQREFTRLGSSVATPLRARVLFATNRNLKQMVGEGTFREDLYYRVNVVGIHAPALRDRREDIPQLARHFLTMYAQSYGKNVTGIGPEALTLLCDYAWPGNIRELENVIQSAIVLADDTTILPSNLPAEFLQSDSKALTDARWSSFEDQLRDYKVKLALEAIKECNGNKTLAAQSLDISRTYLHRLIREPGEDGPALKVA
jgi:DNA-binding NtrC family response regulator